MLPSAPLVGPNAYGTPCVFGRAGTDCPIAHPETKMMFKGLAERPDMPGAAWRYCSNECECIWDRYRCEDDDKCIVEGFTLTPALTGCSDPRLKCGKPGDFGSMCCPVTCGLCSPPGSSFHLDRDDSAFGFRGLRGGCSVASGEGDIFGGQSWYVLDSLEAGPPPPSMNALQELC